MKRRSMEAQRIITVDCDLAALPQTQAAVAAFAHAHGLSQERVHALELVVDEVISNIVRYGFAGSANTPCIQCEAKVVSPRLVLTFIDNGAPFDPLTEAPAPDLTASIEDRSVGGLGIHLVKTISDSCDYRWADGFNRLEVAWRID